MEDKDAAVSYGEDLRRDQESAGDWRRRRNKESNRGKLVQAERQANPNTTEDVSGAQNAGAKL